MVDSREAENAGMAKAKEALKALEDFAKEHGFYVAKVDRFKATPRVYVAIVSFLTEGPATLTQGLSRQFYNKITPAAMAGRRVPSISSTERNNYMFQSPKHLLNCRAISFIKSITDGSILVCMNSAETKIYRHTNQVTRPFQEPFEVIATLDGMKG